MSYVSVWAVMMMIGTMLLARSARHTSKPDMSGSRRSSSTRSASRSANAASPLAPSGASRTLYPSSSRARVRARRIWSSSSMKSSECTGDSVPPGLADQARPGGHGHGTKLTLAGSQPSLPAKHEGVARRRRRWRSRHPARSAGRRRSSPPFSESSSSPPRSRSSSSLAVEGVDALVAEDLVVAGEPVEGVVVLAAGDPVVHSASPSTSIVAAPRRRWCRRRRRRRSGRRRWCRR